MKTYDLHDLGCEKFQHLVNIVFEHKKGIPINSFRSIGRDGGRDGAGTIATIKNEEIVLQAKHTSDPDGKLTMGQLDSIFINKESKKIKRLIEKGMCHKYYAVTNYSVTGEQNEHFRNKIQEIGVEVADLFGKETLNRWISGMPPELLKDFPCLCRDKNELISEKLKEIYKKESETLNQTESFTNAETNLQKKNFVFLLGKERSGKTSMMKQLALRSGTIMPIIKARDFHDNAKEQSHIFMVDDSFGKSQINNEEATMWGKLFDFGIITLSIYKIGNKMIMTSRNQIYEDVKDEFCENFRNLLENSHIDLSQDKDLQNKIATGRSKSPPSPDSNLEENKTSKENERSANKRKKKTKSGNQQSSSSPESNSKRGRSASTLSTKTSRTETKKGHVSIDLFSKDDTSLSHSEALERIVNEVKQGKIKLEADKAAYKLTLCISQTGLKLNVSCPNLDFLESLWDDYLSGKLRREVSKSFELNGFSALNLGMYISPEEYLNCFHEFKAGELVPELSFHKLNKPNFAVLAISAVEDAYGIHLVAVHSEEFSAVKSRVEKIELSGQVYRDQNVALTAVFASKENGIEIGDEELIDIFGFGDEKREKLGAKEEVHVYFVVTNYKVMRTQKEKLLRHYQTAGVKHAIIIDVNHLKILVYKSVTVQRVLLHLLIESLDIPDEGQTPIDITSANETPVSLNESEARRETASEASYPCKHSNKLPGAVLIDVQNPMHLRKRKSSFSLESNSKRSKSTSSSSTKASATETKKGHLSIELICKDAALLSHNEARQYKIKLETGLRKVAPNVKLDDISQTSLMLKLKVICPDLKCLDSLWEGYLSGKLLQQLSSGFVLNGFKCLNLGIFISPEEYLNCFHELKAGELVPELSFHNLNELNFAVLAISAVEDAYGIHLVAVHSEDISAVKSRVEKIELSGQVYRDQNVALTAVFVSKDGTEIGDEKLIDIFGFRDKKKQKRIANKEVHVYFVVTNYKLITTQQEKLLKHYQAAGIKHAIILDVNRLKILVYKFVTVQRVLLHLLIESLDIPDEGREVNQKLRKRTQKRTERRTTVGIRLQGSVPKKLKKRFKCPTKSVTNLVVRRGSHSPYKRTFKKEISSRKARKVSKTRKLPSYL